MWKINWKLVSVLVIIGGLVSVFVYSNTKSAIIFIVALIITAFMADKADAKAKERRKELIKKYYNICGDFTRRQDIVEKLTKEIRRETGRKLSVDFVLGESALVINEIIRTGEKQ